MHPHLALISIAFALATGVLSAQSQQPYAGLEVRPIKALSEQQIADLRAGRGMGLALVAEFNGYPGPMHVLELADSLALSDQQRAKMQDLFVAMRAEAIPLGDKLIAHEAELDGQFAHKTISPASLAASMAAIGTTQAELAPVIGGMKIVESWTRGISDYTNNSGEARTYGIYVLENGDKFFTRGSLVAIQGPEARNLTAITVGPITGGTGKLARINGMARMITLANPQTGMNETKIEIDYWLPQ